MNRQYWIGVASAFGLGAIAGAVAVRVKLEKKYMEDYKISYAALEHTFDIRMYNMVHRELDEQEFNLNEVAINGDKGDDGIVLISGDSISLKNEPNLWGGAVENYEKPETNNYHRAMSAVETGIEPFVAGAINDYGVSYIEEEEFFNEEDGRTKNQIMIVMNDMEPTFLLGGLPCDDWAERVGDSILVDFYKHVPPGINPVLYVRNHRTDEDYEVIRSEP